MLAFAFFKASQHFFVSNKSAALYSHDQILTTLNDEEGFPYYF